MHNTTATREDVAPTPTRHRVAVLWPGPSGYLSTCLRALRRSADVFLGSPGAWPAAPFDEDAIEAVDPTNRWISDEESGGLLAALDRFQPDVLLVSSWHIPLYRRVLRAFRGKALRVLCMDNTWHSTAKQWGGRVASRLYVRPLYECAFVPGERQAQFARMLGFRDQEIIRGLYSADCPSFNRGEREGAELAANRTFLFAGRLVDTKGVDVLADAYELYRATISSPWRLVVAGAGPLADRLQSVAGVDVLGFLQPQELVLQMHTASCFVLPSRFEPWGVVLHEAACAGLPLICSTAVGAGDAFLQDGYNGRLIATADASSLAEALSDVSSCSSSALAAMSAGSRALSQRLTPESWARHLLAEIGRRPV